MNLLPSQNSCAVGKCTSATATFSASGALPAGGHFSIDGGTLSNLANFGGFLQIPEAGPATRTTTFHLYVDGKLIATKDATYQVYQP